MNTPSNRVPCATPGCPNTIQPATAARNGGYCGPCAGKRDREAWEAHVRANRRDVDRFAGVTDPVELLWLMHTSPKYDPLVNLIPSPRTFEEIYSTLSPDDVRRLADVLIAQMASNKDAVEDAAVCIAAFTESSLDRFLEVWLGQCDAYPPILFRNAGAAVRDRLVRMLSMFAPDLVVSHALSALATIGDQEVVRLLQTASSKRPFWSRKLHGAPTDYARDAGWEIVDGERRELTLSHCVALKVADLDDAAPPTKHVSVWKETSEPCPWCGGITANLLTVDLTSLQLDAVALLGDRVEVLTCPDCTCYGPVHAILEETGRGFWSNKNVRPNYLPAPDAANSRVTSDWSSARIQLQHRSPIQASDWRVPTTFSQIGGLPTWVQNTEYPRCLQCNKTMIFLAQIDEGAFPGNEGFYYAFVCKECRTTATIYQQT